MVMGSSERRLLRFGDGRDPFAEKDGGSQGHQMFDSLPNGTPMPGATPPGAFVRRSCHVLFARGGRVSAAQLGVEAEAAGLRVTRLLQKGTLVLARQGTISTAIA
jgi:hypothetical protein